MGPFAIIQLVNSGAIVLIVAGINARQFISTQSGFLTLRLHGFLVAVTYKHHFCVQLGFIAKQEQQ